MLPSETYLYPYKRHYRRQSTYIHKEIPTDGYLCICMNEHTHSRICKGGHNDRHLSVEIYRTANKNPL